MKRADPDLKFFYSPGSRYSYLALTQMPRIEQEYEVSFDWIPTVGGRIREIRGADPFAGPPLSGQYDWEYRQKDAEAWADYYGVPFQEPQSVKFDARLLGVTTAAAKELGLEREYSIELASEVFARGSWPIDRRLCVRVAEAIGLDREAFAGWVESPRMSAQIEANCQQAVELGVFGNPTFIVSDALYWGQDRLALVEYALGRRADSSSSTGA